MSVPSEIAEFREQARHHEAELPSAQRKSLGQFFTGLPLGRVLAHLALEPETCTILDPFAGTGDLLDAVQEAAAARNIEIERLDAIEYDRSTATFCKTRLCALLPGGTFESDTVTGDAFSNTLRLPVRQYDLVITNPPYVRYQSLNGRAEGVRKNLAQRVEDLAPSASKGVWTALSEKYSGLADLSVPAWLLSAMLVRPCGRLALVVPATWRTREYADIIRYLMLRCFRIEAVVEDTQSGWFSDALVRTHLIVARRLTDDEAAVPISERTHLGTIPWLEVSPEAAAETSLLGAAFPGDFPEAQFAVRAADCELPLGIARRPFDLTKEWLDLKHQDARRSWLAHLEPSSSQAGTASHHSTPILIPEAIAALLADKPEPAVISLEEAGVSVGQGLRTGGNRFFYVRAVGKPRNGTQAVKIDPAFGGDVIEVPEASLRPVMHRQADLPQFCKGHMPDTRVLDLRQWAHPDDLETLKRASPIAGDALPQEMPPTLASYVASAAHKQIAGGKPIPKLSAVRTNVRAARPGIAPRFWYMLPDFQPRHMPQAFAPRINHDEPSAFANVEPVILIDANFSTFWSKGMQWPTGALASLLNSAWCRANMEALGTPLGGGALKLEAVQLRKLRLPKLGETATRDLAALWKPRPSRDALDAIDKLVLSAVFPSATDTERAEIAAALYEGLASSIDRRRKGVA